ncbi:MAG TPA: (Fe-S)-binding protein [Candidatus Acidoferrales bacterium]|nr:(Fe-S)-binding protein [Candidatus Acidoferrales bacterium]
MTFLTASIVALLIEGLSQAAVLACLAASGWLFWRTLDRRHLARIPKAEELPPGRIGKRIWRTFLEVVLQYRVVRDRPIAGILHAFVVWGFLAFAWISARHFYFGIRGLEHAQEDQSWYGTFVAVWAIAVLVGILGLSFRRFVLRPPALGALSPTSGLVAALISALMVTYLLGWRMFPVGSTAWKANWWAHTLAFLALLVVIPQSKHLHLVLAPFAIFLRPETTSAMRALRDDGEDLGMVRVKDLRWKDVLDINACVECGRCTDFCPANLSGGSLSPKEIILGMQHGLLRGGEMIAGTAAEKTTGAAWVSEEDLFQCLSCGACEYVCPVGIEHVGSKILDLRRGLVSEGRVSNDKIVQLFTTMERAPHNPWGIAQDARQKLVETKQFPIFDGSQEWLFWLGCGLSFDPHGQAVASAMKEILDAAGVSWGVLARETCCGEPARRAGNEYLYLQLSEKLTESFRKNRVKNILSCCPHCTTMLDKDYRQIASYAEMGIRVLHHSELLVELLPKLPLRPAAENVTYHDPCYLARGRGITEAPRQILQACGVSLTEASHHGQNTSCCGAGGAQLFITDDRREGTRERANQRRFAQLAETKASTIAVACPYCPIMLRDAAGHAKRDDVAILDVAELTARRLQKVGSGEERKPAS